MRNAGLEGSWLPLDPLYARLTPDFPGNQPLGNHSQENSLRGWPAPHLGGSGSGFFGRGMGGCAWGG